MNNEDKGFLREAIGWTLGSALGIFALVVVFIFLSGIGYIVYQRTLGVGQANADTAVTRHTNQYITTQQTRMDKDIKTWIDDDTAVKAGQTTQDAVQGQQHYALSDLCDTAKLISGHVSESDQAFITQHGGCQ